MGGLGARCWRGCQDLITIGDGGLLMGLEGGWMGMNQTYVANSNFGSRLFKW